MQQKQKKILKTKKLKDFDNKQMNVTLRQNTIEQGKKQEYIVTYNCLPNSKWGRIYLNVYINETHQKNLNFSFLKICNNPQQKYDISILILMVVSIIIAGIGAIQIENPIIIDNEEQIQEVSKTHAFTFVLTASFFLIILYYFYYYLSQLLKILILISGFSSSSLLITEYLDKLQFMPKKNFEFKYLGILSFNYIVSCCISSILILFYALTQNWILSNLIAFSIIFLMFKIIRVPSYKIAFILLSMAFLYDIYWVFLSSNIFGQSVMAAVATKLDLPMMLYCPKLSDYPVQTCSLIGLGDIALPGIFLAYCYKFSRQKYNNSTYFLTSYAGYIIGILICVICLTVFNTAQPALLYLSPCTLIPVGIHALLKNDFMEMWNGIQQKVNFEKTNGFQQQEIKGTFQYLDEKDEL
ncbi:signal peptide peptidase 2b, putative [Ichthyophthirius multifiliis]|uniref:Signal peptide peptidase 2b, putative n=1 Tax=Ichthyophthirius multifiliis TaxID=5932 RepID=G0QV65_ICHMU|nr:signal peptide peptidase 2b, putative [Ichthyophthirius multifiliis]EGR30906.1 signal peptide peptidase 2b, putative [Ichthyophthirius multifiliis]|eukprot:XP_004032493.1 signal peptide peptidase 2b, putative [Ichthyophthirius multifiliis]